MREDTSRYGSWTWSNEPDYQTGGPHHRAWIDHLNREDSMSDTEAPEPTEPDTPDTDDTPDTEEE